MNFRSTDKIELVKAIQRFYQERLSLAPEAIFPVAHPLNPGRPFPASGPFFVGLNMGPGRFTLEEQAGPQLREDVAFTAMAYVRMQRDWGGRDEAFYLDATTGALALQQKLLAIVGEELKNPEGDGLIASRVYAVGTVQPSYDTEQMIGWTGINFQVEFDWDMAAAADFGDDG